MTTVPKTWAVASGEDLFSLIRGVSYDKSDASGSPSNSLVPVLRANNISDAQIVADDLVYVPSRYVSPEQYLRNGDLLIAASSGSRTVVGKAARANESHERFAFGAFCAVARPRNSEFSFWLSSYMNSRAYRDYVEQVALGISINNLRGSDLKAMPIQIAPLPEQRRIVTKIDSLSAKSGRAKDNLDHIPRLVEKYKQAILAAAFRGDLTGKWRETHECQRPSFSEHRIDERVTELSQLPDTWCWAAMDDIAVITGGLTKNPKRELLPHKVPYLRVANVYANELRLNDIAEIGCTAAELAKTRLQKDDLLVVEGNGSLDQLGRVAVWNDNIADCSHQNHIIRARPRRDVIAKYALYWLLSPSGRNYIEAVASSSSGLHTLSISKVGGLPIPICGIDEQQEAVRLLDAAFSWINRLAAATTSARKLIDHLDQAVLAKAFRGKLVPQDPNDEPASVLLERIGADRATGAGKKAQPVKRRREELLQGRNDP